MDAELGVGVGEVNLHRVDRHEQAPGDLLVRQPARRQVDHPLLGRRQTARWCRPLGPEKVELITCLPGPARRAKRIELRARRLERPPCRRALPGAPCLPAEPEQRPGPVEAQAKLAVAGGRVGQSRGGTLVVPGGEPGHRRAATGRGQCPRMFLALRQIAQMGGDRVCLGDPAQPHQRFDQVASHGKGARVGYALAQGVFPDLAQGTGRPLGLMGEQRGDPARPQHLQLVPFDPGVASCWRGSIRPPLRLVRAAVERGQ
jgi:hypothetical protein